MCKYKTIYTPNRGHFQHKGTFLKFSVLIMDIDYFMAENLSVNICVHVYGMGMRGGWEEAFKNLLLGVLHFLHCPWHFFIK